MRAATARSCTEVQLLAVARLPPRGLCGRVHHQRRCQLALDAAPVVPWRAVRLHAASCRSERLCGLRSLCTRPARVRLHPFFVLSACIAAFAKKTDSAN